MEETKENPFEKDGCCLRELREEDRTALTGARTGRSPFGEECQRDGRSCGRGGGSTGRVTVVSLN